MNVDYKIASKAIARRIEKFLPQPINTDQTGFMKGGYIGQNIRRINDIMEQTKLQNISLSAKQSGKVGVLVDVLDKSEEGQKELISIIEEANKL